MPYKQDLWVKKQILPKFDWHKLCDIVKLWQARYLLIIWCPICVWYVVVTLDAEEARETCRQLPIIMQHVCLFVYILNCYVLCWVNDETIILWTNLPFPIILYLNSESVTCFIIFYFCVMWLHFLFVKFAVYQSVVVEDVVGNCWLLCYLSCPVAIGWYHIEIVWFNRNE